MSANTLSNEDLTGFRDIQRLAYDCAEAIAADLQPGVSEKDVAKKMESWLMDHGVDDWFHKPFAWFGDRTAFDGFIGFKHLGGFNPAFYPSNRRLEEGMPYILDCAPSRHGYTADIGYCGVVGENKLLEQLMDDLLEYRVLLLEQVRQRLPLADISRAVDSLCSRHGYEPRHKAYPFETLAHRVELLKDDGKQSHINLAHFGLRNIRELVAGGWGMLKGGDSPIWNSGKRADHAPTPGLWAVEPHLGFRGTGAKWEELLVVTETDAYWLDDDVPHVRRWQSRGLWPLEKVA